MPTLLHSTPLPTGDTSLTLRTVLWQLRDSSGTLRAYATTGPGRLAESDLPLRYPTLTPSNPLTLRTHTRILSRVE